MAHLVESINPAQTYHMLDYTYACDEHLSDARRLGFIGTVHIEDGLDCRFCIGALPLEDEIVWSDCPKCSSPMNDHDKQQAADDDEYDCRNCGAWVSVDAVRTEEF